MTKTRKLSVLIALGVTAAVSAVAGGALLDRSSVAFAEEDYTIVNADGDRIVYGAGWGAEASQKVVNAFKAKMNVAEPEIKIYKANGAGDAVAFAAEKDGSKFIYNALNDEVYEVKGNFALSDLNVKVRVIGAPVAEEATNVTVVGYDGDSGAAVNVASGTKVQLFETGIIVENGSNVEVHTGVLEKTGDTAYTIHPLINDQDVLATGRGNKITANEKQLGFIGDIDGTWHALRTARTSRNGDHKLVVKYNFRAGCVEVVYNDDWSISSRMAYAGQNFNAEGAQVDLPMETYTTDEHLWTGVEDSALSMYRSLSENSDATETDLKNAFREGYENLVENEGVIPGYRCSNIKVWSFVVLDFKYSPDSSYGFDGVGSAGRERMYTLVYSGVKNAVYGVGDDFWQAWKEDGIRPQLGAPMSNVMYNKTISGITYERIQIFEKGYIYGKAGGALVTETGVTTDENYTEFKYKASPAAPTEYGVQVGDPVEKTENGRTVYYFNYQKGAAKATQMAAKTGYLYDYYPGRNFVEENGAYKTKLLTYDQLYSDGTFTLQDSTFPGHWDSGFSEDFTEEWTGVKEMLIEKVKALLQAGFFPGFPDGGFRSWNNVYGLQMIYGDSTAMPFGGDARTNVCAIMWNETLNRVFLVKDAFMDAWGGKANAHQYLGAPSGDEFTLDANKSITFQYYNGSSHKNDKAFAVSSGYNAATWFTPNTSEVTSVNPEQYLSSLSQLSKPLTSVKLSVEDYDLTVDGYASLAWEIEGAWADATIKFTCSNHKIATVMDDGSVEFLQKGKVTVTITVSDGVNTVEDSVTFTVK